MSSRTKCRLTEKERRRVSAHFSSMRNEGMGEGGGEWGGVRGGAAGNIEFESRLLKDPASQLHRAII